MWSVDLVGWPTMTGFEWALIGVLAGAIIMAVILVGWFLWTFKDVYR